MHPCNFIFYKFASGHPAQWKDLDINLDNLNCGAVQISFKYNYVFYLDGQLPFLILGTTPGVTTLFVPANDDGTSPLIPVSTGFLIGNTNQNFAFVSYTFQTT